jgi:phage/plasmid-associated DNA primase
LLNIVGDLPTSDGLGNLHMNEGMLKDVSSGGDIPVERKGKDPLTAAAIARCIFASNSLPAFADRSNGIWDRLRIIPFNERFRGTSRHNPNLKREIAAAELPGIFNWAIEGLAKLRGMKRFPEHPEGKGIASEHRLACDHESQFLLEDYEEKEDALITKVELYNAYQEFCRANGYRPKNAANFGREVKRIFPSAYEGREFLPSGRQRVWMNIKKQI